VSVDCAACCCCPACKEGWGQLRQPTGLNGRHLTSILPVSYGVFGGGGGGGGSRQGGSSSK
jgi:hypothetical protein